MANQPRQYPQPKTRFAARRWRIRWNVREKSYEFSTGYQRAEKDKAEYAGLCRGEICRLRWVDIDLSECWLHVKLSKTDRPRHVPISPALLSTLKPFAKKNGYVAAHWQNAKVSAEIKADNDLAALVKKMPELSTKIKWNVFRHTFASLLAQIGKVTIDQICAMMGNTPEVCRRHCAHLIPNAAANTGIHLID